MNNDRDITATGQSSAPWRQAPDKVFVVLPAYNEQPNLGVLLETIDDVLHEEHRLYEVVLVDDGSHDGTCAEAEQRAGFMPIHLERHAVNEGLGATIRDGLRAAASRCGDRDVVVTMDADNTQPPGLILTMLQRVREGADVVIASRYRSGACVRGVPLHRRMLSWSAAWLCRLVVGIEGVRDFTCGYRAYRGDVLKRAFEVYGDRFIDQEGFQCMVDILLKLRRLDLVFAEVPLILRYDRKGGGSKMKLAQTIAQTMVLICRRRLGR